MKRKAVIPGCLVLLIGIALAIGSTGAVVFNLVYIRPSLAEFSTSTVTVPANEDFVFEVKSRGGRYEYDILSDSSLDLYVIYHRDLPIYRAGNDFFHFDHSENFKSRDTWVEIGAGDDFDIVLINHEPNDASAIIKQTLFPDPPVVVVWLLRISFWIWILAIIGGSITIIVGFLRKAF